MNGDRAIKVATPKLWNDLPNELRTIQDITDDLAFAYEMQSDL